jgi:hypothetical protein
MAHKVIVPQKKIISRSFLNSGTLIVIIFKVNFDTSHMLLYILILYWQINVKVYYVMQNFYATR